MPSRKSSWFNTITGWTITSIGFFLHFILASTLMWFFKDREYAHLRMTRPFIRLIFRVFGVKLAVSGLDHVPRNQTVIFMSNHQSLLDIFSYLSVIPVKFAFVGKKELFKIPLLGWDMKLEGHIGIDRENPRHAMAQLGEMAELVKGGKSLMIYPEGTRTLTGRVNAFKRGSFQIAAMSGATIIPCYINGTNQIIRKNSMKVYPGDITVCFAPPITPPSDYEQLNPKAKKEIENALLEQTHRAVLALEKEILEGLPQTRESIGN